MCKFFVRAGKNNEIKSNVKFSWKEVAMSSDDDEEEDWLIPEFEATLHAMGGIFTLDSISRRKNTAHSQEIQREQNLNRKA